jgi:hypothetical protein
MDEKGYIQYTIDWEERAAPSEEEVAQLIAWRQRLYEAGLIGVDKNGLGYGNISERRDPGFMISGTQTGHLYQIEPRHFAHVTEYDIEQNWIRCRGPMKASSEALSHAILYDVDPEIGAVIHVHSAVDWERLLNELPTTESNAEPGTVAMAEAIGRLFAESDLPQTNVLVMGGHREGLMSFGRDLDEAGKAILRHCSHPRERPASAKPQA